MFEVWAQSRFDGQRLRRLLVGACAGAAILAIGSYAATRGVHKPVTKPVEEEEKVVDVTLVDAPDEPAEEVAAPELAPPQPAPRPPPVTQAKAIPPPSDPYGPDPAPGGGGRGQGDGDGQGSGLGNPPPPPPPPPAPPPPPPPPPKAAAPKVSPADYDPPKCKRRGIDSARAKAIGVEGKVIVTYTVTTSGAVVNVSASGPPELVPLAIAAVQGWTCEPARMKADGSAMQVTKKVPLNVKLQ